MELDAVTIITLLLRISPCLSITAFGSFRLPRAYYWLGYHRLVGIRGPRLRLFDYSLAGGAAACWGTGINISARDLEDGNARNAKKNTSVVTRKSLNLSSLRSLFALGSALIGPKNQSARSLRSRERRGCSAGHFRFLWKKTVFEKIADAFLDKIPNTAYSYSGSWHLCGHVTTQGLGLRARDEALPGPDNLVEGSPDELV